MRIEPQPLIDLLRAQTGPQNGLHVHELAELLTGEAKNQGTWRNIRSVIKGLRLQGWPICGHPSRGYYWASSPEDLQATITFLRDRAMSSLLQISKLKKVAIPLLEGQLSLPLDAVLLLEPEQPNYARVARQSYVVEVSKPLVVEMERFFVAHPGYDRQQLIEDALSMFLNGYEVLKDE
jgi:hypothetical protein